MADNKTITLAEQNKLERDYYLRKTDKVPGSDKTVKELREEYVAGVKKEGRRMAERYEANQKKIRDERGPDIIASAVTAGVVVDRVMPSPLPIMVVPHEVEKEIVAENEPTREDLLKMSKSDLQDKALEDHFHQVPDSMTKMDIVDNVILPDDKTK